jgi:hypothetical protein
MVTIQEIFNSDWPEALAAGAYQMIYARNPEILDRLESPGDFQAAYDLGVNIKSLHSDPRCLEFLNLLITEIALAYIVERTTNRSNLGGPYTLIGHARQEVIEFGFIALVCGSLDNFGTFEKFKEHNSLDRKVVKAINTGDMGDMPAVMEQRRIAWITLEEECQSLKALAGI